MLPRSHLVLPPAVPLHRSGQMSRLREDSRNDLRPASSPRHALVGAVIGAVFVLLIALLGLEPQQMYPAGLLGVWLCFGSLIRYWALVAQRSAPAEASRWIPLRFSGPTGRFWLRPRGDGRRVEVRARSQVVAEVVAADAGDEIVLGGEPVADSELEEFGTALGRAIEMAVAADEDSPAERHVAGPASWGRPEAGFRGG